jgi:hypothetical protein
LILWLLLRPNSWFETEIADRRLSTDGRGIAGRCGIVNNEKPDPHHGGENLEISSGKSEPGSFFGNEKTPSGD